MTLKTSHNLHKLGFEINLKLLLVAVIFLFLNLKNSETIIKTNGERK